GDQHRPRRRARTRAQRVGGDDPRRRALLVGHGRRDRPPAVTDPRDPRHLAPDAPLLDAWLRFTAAQARGEVTPFSVPGHKHRTDLVGDVIRGDVPLYAGLAPVKETHALLA